MRREEDNVPAGQWHLAEPPARSRDFGLTRLSATMVWLLALPMAANAQFTPPALPPGDTTYRLIFVTSTSTLATSNEISDYNTFVQGVAATNTISLPATIWSAVASTDTTDAITNLGSVCSGSCLTAPIYLVDGTTEVAAGQAQLFGASPGMMHSIDEDENANTTFPYVWTGSSSNGTVNNRYTGTYQSTQHGLGDPVAGTGSAASTGGGAFSFYVRFGNTTPFSGQNDQSLPLYAISGQLTEGPVPTPEPASGALLLAGGVATGLVRRLRRKRQPAA